MLYENGGPGCSDGYWTPPVLEEPAGLRYGCIWAAFDRCRLWALLGLELGMRLGLQVDTIQLNLTVPGRRQ